MTDLPETISFYSVRAPYGQFSNFAPYPIEIDGETWPTSEHYFQAQKFVGTPQAEVIRQASGGKAAAKAGRSRSHPIRSDWLEVRDDVMRTALRAKFTQHPKLADLLRGTGDALLVEHTDKDRYWGDGGDGSGVNRLGEILTELRAELQQ